MIDHVTVSVKNLIDSKIFYEKVLAVFNYQVSFGKEEEFWAFDIGDGAPGLRPQYTATYYAAFIIDPSGHNIEAVCHKSICIDRKS